jgi:glycosyltransferase involved in cell wall biosynthesis
MTELKIPKAIIAEDIKFPHIKLNEIIELYEHLVALALSQTNNGIFNDALKTISDAAKIAYLINWRYGDERLEVALKKISHSLFENSGKISNKTTGKVVFFDSWGLDSRGLSLQYIRALNASSSSILFICESRNESGSISLREELSRGLENKIIYLDSIYDEDEKSKKIKNEISNFGPSHIFMHMTPWATGAIAAFHAFPDVVRYQVNLTDHAYWLGADCSDYIIEFRNYGATVSQEKRGIDSDRIIFNPFYPIIEDNHSNKLPERNKGDVVIFTGGAYYKMYGRDGFFFDLILKILDEHPNVIFWIAGHGRGDLLQKRLHHYLKSGRVRIIGDRKDINAVFKACDIYLATYPFSGGLMAQLATANGVPILSFTSPDLALNRLEDIVGVENNFIITVSDLEAFERRASMFIKNADARFEVAYLASQAMHSRSGFDFIVSKLIINTNELVHDNIQKISIDYKVLTGMYLEIENFFQDSLARRIVRTITFRMMLNFPSITIKSIIHVFSFLIFKYRNKIIQLIYSLPRKLI